MCGALEEDAAKNHQTPSKPERNCGQTKDGYHYPIPKHHDKSGNSGRETNNKSEDTDDDSEIFHCDYPLFFSFCSPWNTYIISYFAALVNSFSKSFSMFFVSFLSVKQIIKKGDLYLPIIPFV